MGRVLGERGGRFKLGDLSGTGMFRDWLGSRIEDIQRFEDCPWSWNGGEAEVGKRSSWKAVEVMKRWIPPPFFVFQAPHSNIRALEIVKVNANCWDCSLLCLFENKCIPLCSILDMLCIYHISYITKPISIISHIKKSKKRRKKRHEAILSTLSTLNSLK